MSHSRCAPIGRGHFPRGAAGAFVASDGASFVTVAVGPIDGRWFAERA